MEKYKYKEIVFDDIIHKGFVFESDVVVRIDQNKYGTEHGFKVIFKYK